MAKRGVLHGREKLMGWAAELRQKTLYRKVTELQMWTCVVISSFSKRCGVRPIVVGLGGCYKPNLHAVAAHEPDHRFLEALHFGQQALAGCCQLVLMP